MNLPGIPGDKNAIFINQNNSYINERISFIKTLLPEIQLLPTFMGEEQAKFKITEMRENNWFFKFGKWIAWISGGIGLCFLVLGVFQVVFGLILYLSGAERVGAGRLVSETEIINFFIASISFFSLLILWFLIQIRYQLKKNITD